LEGTTAVAGLLKLKIIYHTSRDPEVIQSLQPRIEGEWMHFADGSGTVRLIRAADVERVERAD
jgi:hypothetical protein